MAMLAGVLVFAVFLVVGTVVVLTVTITTVVAVALGLLFSPVVLLALVPVLALRPLLKRVASAAATSPPGAVEEGRSPASVARVTKPPAAAPMKRAA